MWSSHGSARSGSLCRNAISCSVDAAQPTVLAVVDLVPVELGPFEGRRVLRIGNLVGVPAVLGELALAALGGRPCQLGFRMGAEELERRRRPPLLTHEKHSRIGRPECQRRLDGQLAEAEVLRRPVADRAVADLVVRQRVRQQPRRRDGRRVQRPAVPAMPERRVRPGVEVAVLQRLCQRLQRPEIRVVALPFARHRGVYRVMDVVVPLRGHPVAAAIAGCDQPRVVEVALGDQRQRPAQLFAASASVSAASSSRMWMAVVSTSACTASSRRPSAWKSRIHRSAQSMI